MVNLLFYEDLTDVVLVGHSYAGFVITGVAEAVPERLRHLVYLDAGVPADGQAGFDGYPRLRARFEEYAVEVNGARVQRLPMPDWLTEV